MKKRLGKAMPHIPLLKLKPEFAEQDKNDQETTKDDDVADGQGDDEANVYDNETCEHDSDIYHFICLFCGGDFCRRQSC